jgi:hypothetical protein
MDSPNFDVKARVPVRPLSYDNKDSATPKELIIDYTKGKVYVCDENGIIIDISVNSDTLQAVVDYFTDNPTLITENITIELNGQDVPLSDAIYGHTHKYATETEPGFIRASDQKKLNTVEEGANKTIVDETISEESTNPVQAKAIYDALSKYLALAGGILTGPVSLSNNTPIKGFTSYGVPMLIAYLGEDNKIHFGNIEEAVDICIDAPIILNSNSFGDTFPENPRDGQLFFKII